MIEQPTTPEAIAAAWRSLSARGALPSLRAVNLELLRMRGAGASLRDIVPIVAALRAEAESNPRIGEVVNMFESLDIVARREAARRMEQHAAMLDKMGRLAARRSADFHPVPPSKRTKGNP